MKALRTCIGAFAVVATALTALPATTIGAQAGDYRAENLGNRHYKHYRHSHVRGHRHYKHGRHHYRKHRGHKVDGDAAAVILGLTGLAIVGGALAHQNRTYDYRHDPNYRHNNRGHYPPAPKSPRVITYGGSLEPWSPGWYAWCENRYRSFNPERGTFRGYDGKDHFCVPR